MEPQEERTSALSQLTQRKKELSTLEEELAAFGASDPAKLEEKKRAVFLAKEAAIRWTGEHRWLILVTPDGQAHLREIW